MALPFYSHISTEIINLLIILLPKIGGPNNRRVLNLNSLLRRLYMALYLLRPSKNTSVWLMGGFWGGLMTPRNCEIVDCGTFCEVIFFCISPKNLLGDFFDSLAMNVAFLNLPKVII